MASKHVPVLLKEVLASLAIQRGGIYVDCTAGGGGHAEAILAASGPDGRLLALDRDAEAVERVRKRLAEWNDRCCVVQSDFSEVFKCAKALGFTEVDGILMDLGMSSFQIDEPERGFSFAKDGPLDMRMDQSSPRTAADVVNEESAEELQRILKDFGEEPGARRIAAALVERRHVTPFRRTAELAELVEKVKGGRRGRIHPATRTFQALRMAVNTELDSLASGLESAISLLGPGGRLAVISFHSLEDRMVKRTFAAHVGRWESLQAGGRRRIVKEPVMSWVERKPITAEPEEVTRNPRARSAKLRVVQKEG